MDNKDRKTFELPLTTSKKAVENARFDILEGKSGKVVALKTRWKKVNELLKGGFRFGNNVLLAGASGHGKSYFLNMLHRDFLNPEINGKFEYPFKILHFNFEMSSNDEILRSLSGILGISYSELISAETKITDEMYDLAMEKMELLTNEDIFYVEKPGNRFEVIDTIYGFQKKFPDHKIIVTLDHTLLVEELQETSEVELIAKLSKQFIDVRKDLGTLAILVGQLNDNIEDQVRIAKPSLHYPMKKDIFSSKQIFHAMDMVIVVHQPELLGLEYYGSPPLPTQGLIAYHLLKMRKGLPGMVTLVNDLAHGGVVEGTTKFKL